MTYSQIRVNSVDRITTISFNRPEAMNAITLEMLEELKHAFQSAGNDDAIDVVILTGEGRAFCAGLDLKELGSREIAGGQVGDVLNNAARDVINLIESIPKVVIGRINGACITGGLEIVVACDLIVVAEEAKLGDTHAKWGLRPSWGLSQRLPLAVGMANARELSYTARLFTGSEAFAMGLAIRCAPLDELDSVLSELTSLIVKNSRGSLAAYKDLYKTAQPTTLYEGLEYEFGTDYPINDAGERLSAFTKK